MTALYITIFITPFQYLTKTTISIHIQLTKVFQLRKYYNLWDLGCELLAKVLSFVCPAIQPDLLPIGLALYKAGIMVL